MSSRDAVRSRSIFAIGALSCVLSALAACSETPSNATPGNGATPAVTPLRCAVGEMRQCPCVGAGVGIQACNTAGTYDLCSGCAPTAGNAPTAAGSGGASGAATAGASGSSAGVGGTAAIAAGSGGAAGSTDAGASGDAGMADAPIGSEPGTSCGEALPVLCAQTSEKCCVRGLRTDTCIPSGETCSCDLANCSVLEVSCDGPEDCDAGQVCCGSLGGQSGSYVSFLCSAQCSFNGNQREACHEDAATCPDNLVCANSQLLSNVQVCIDPASIEQ